METLDGTGLNAFCIMRWHALQGAGAECLYLNVKCPQNVHGLNVWAAACGSILRKAKGPFQGRQAIGREAVLPTSGTGWFAGLLVYGHAV